MEIISIKEKSPISEVKLIEFKRFSDDRGYFTETFRQSDFLKLDFFLKSQFLQINESFSQKNVFRGFHLQWQPPMGKLVRCVSGHLIDFALDIRVKSSNFGKALMIDLKQEQNSQTGQWVWLPPGFAHGVWFLEPTIIEYLCTAEYSPQNEVSINPLCEDIDWGLCNQALLSQFEKNQSALIVSEKDKKGLTLKQWKAHKASAEF